MIIVIPASSPRGKPEFLVAAAGARGRVYRGGSGRHVSKHEAPARQVFTGGAVTDRRAGLTLTQGVLCSGLSTDQLWLGYVGVGGHAGEVELEAYVAGALVPTTVEHDKIAVVLNEAIRDRDPWTGYPVAYWFTDATDTRP